MTGKQAYQPRRPRRPAGWSGRPSIRYRTGRRAGNQPGQPETVRTDPDRIPHRKPERHVCAECFGPRSRYSRKSPFCCRCERALFGTENDGYGKFIRHERALNLARQRKREAAS